MSLTKEVAAIIAELGHGTAEDVWPEVLGTVTRAQVIQALQNARHTGLLVSDGALPAVKGTKSARLTTYRPAPKRGPARPVSSVWDYARAVAAGWRAA